MSDTDYSELERKQFIDANRVAWNEIAPVHEKINQQTLKEKFSDPSYNGLDKHCMDRFMEIGVHVFHSSSLRASGTWAVQQD